MSEDEFDALRTEDPEEAKRFLKEETEEKGHQARIAEETIKRGGKKVTQYVVKVKIGG